jgi:hypothetical protein
VLLATVGALERRLGAAEAELERLRAIERMASAYIHQPTMEGLRQLHYSLAAAVGDEPEPSAGGEPPPRRLLRIERCAAAVVRYWFVHGTEGDPANWKEYLLPHELELIDAVSLEGAVVLEAKALPPSTGGEPPPRR